MLSDGRWSNLFRVFLVYICFDFEQSFADVSMAVGTTDGEPTRTVSSCEIRAKLTRCRLVIIRSGPICANSLQMIF